MTFQVVGQQRAGELMIFQLLTQLDSWVVGQFSGRDHETEHEMNDTIRTLPFYCKRPRHTHMWSVYADRKSADFFQIAANHHHRCRRPGGVASKEEKRKTK